MGSQLYFGEPGKGHKRVFSDFSGHFIVPRVTLLSPFSSQVHLGAQISLGYTEGADLDTTLTLCRLKNKLLFSMRHQNHLEPLWKTGEADGAFWIISRSSFQRRTHHDFFAFFLWSGAFFVVFFFCEGVIFWLFHAVKGAAGSHCWAFILWAFCRFSFLLSSLWMHRFWLDFVSKISLLSSICYGEEGNKKLKGCDISCSTSSIDTYAYFPTAARY